MALQLLLDMLTGKMALVNVPVAATPPPTPTTGNPIGPGIFLWMTYA